MTSPRIATPDFPTANYKAIMATIEELPQYPELTYWAEYEDLLREIKAKRMEPHERLICLNLIARKLSIDSYSLLLMYRKVYLNRVTHTPNLFDL